MSYLDEYPHCVGCPVSRYCGTMVGSIRLCNSHREDTSPQSVSHDTKEDVYEPEYWPEDTPMDLGDGDLYRL